MALPHFATSWLVCWLLAIACQATAGDLSPIFDGASLSGWVAEGPRPSFEVEQQQIVVTGRANQPNWLRTEREYENFRLHFEYKLSQWAEAAVILRAPRAGRPSQAGIALYLSHDYHTGGGTRSTGAITGVKAPARALKPSHDEWHSVDLSLSGDQFSASIDGVKVQDVRLSADPELAQRLRRGFIGFPDFGYKYWLRNVRLEDLGESTKLIDPLAAGLKGWTLRGGGQWQIREGGVLTGWGGDGVFYAPGEYKDFELSLLVRTREWANSGVFLHGSPDPKLSRGFEIQIYNPMETVYPTGSIYNQVRANLTADLEGRWFLMQISVHGSRCAVRLDGVTVAETSRLPDAHPASGRIGFQFHSADGSVEFRDLRVRVLN